MCSGCSSISSSPVRSRARAAGRSPASQSRVASSAEAGPASAGVAGHRGGGENPSRSGRAPRRGAPGGEEVAQALAHRPDLVRAGVAESERLERPLVVLDGVVAHTDRIAHPGRHEVPGTLAPVAAQVPMAGKGLDVLDARRAAGDRSSRAWAARGAAPSGVEAGGSGRRPPGGAYW